MLSYLNPHNNASRTVFFSPFYRKGNQGTGKVKPKVPELEVELGFEQGCEWHGSLCFTSTRKNDCPFPESLGHQDTCQDSKHRKELRTQKEVHIPATVTH